MARSADTAIKARNYEGGAGKVADAEVVYQGSYMALNTEDAAADDGYFDVWSAAVGQLPVGGFAEAGVTGDTSASPPPEVTFRQDPWIEEQVTVTGASAITKLGQPVYASDDATLTLTRTTRALAIGIVTRYHSGSIVDVLHFGLALVAALSLRGSGKEIWCLGSMDFPSVADGDILTGFPVPKHVAIVDFFAIVDIACTGSGGTVALNLEIGTTNLTNGVLTVSSAAGGTKGAKLSATAITGANVAHEGDTISVEASSTSATRSTGTVNLFIVVENRVGV
jgi:hypothetical protein